MLRPSRRLLWSTGGVALLVSVVLLARAADAAAFHSTWTAARQAPGGAVLALAAYAAAFMLRAAMWTRVQPSLGFGHALAAVHVSLAGNHVLPLRLGEALRVTSVTRRAGTPVAESAAATVLLRAADIAAVAVLAGLLAPPAMSNLAGAGAWVLAGGGLGLSVAAAVWLRRLAVRRGSGLRLPVPLLAAGALAGWVLEAGVLWQAARWAGITIGPAEAVLVTTVTIAAQALAVAPGGIGTYEAAATAALVALGAGTGPALAAAVAAHALKTAYALLAGAVALVAPAPGLLGRLRLPARRAVPATTQPQPGPVVLFLPAHDEEASVAAVVRRVPERVCGRPVRCVVVDDGSTDATAARAAAAGAEVVSLERNGGLGAAVRRGFAEALSRDAAAVAFCDADGEYAPEELERLVMPILAGDADYVVGSRFAGRIERMLLHRRFGNVVLTRLLALVARTRISDGQSGYRALSAAAAADAEVVHDFNYAQVLTLDLLAKGYRYAEVPISYRFREAGRSFVRLGRYLRAVLPAVYKELNPPVPTAPR